MTAFLTRSKLAEIISTILENKICQDNIDRSLIFISTLISILLGTIYVDCEVAKEEKQNLLALLHRVLPPNSPNRQWLIPLVKGVQKQAIYKKIEALKGLADSLTISEKLLIISLGYQLATADEKLDLRENNYLRKVATKIGVTPQQLDVLEAGCGINIKVDRETLNCVRDLLSPEGFRSLDPNLVEIAREIHIALPSPQSDRISSHSIPYSKEPRPSAAKIEDRDCNAAEKIDCSEQTQPNITNINSQILWLQLGEFSGLDVQIRNTRDGLKEQALARADAAWDDWIQALEASLRTQWCRETKNQKQALTSSENPWIECFASFDRLHEEWFSQEEDEDKIKDPQELSRIYAAQFSQELKLVLREFTLDCLQRNWESLNLPLNLMQQRIRGLEETMDIFLADKLLSKLADKLLSKINKAIEDTTVVKSFDGEDTKENENFRLALTPIIDDVMAEILKIKRGRNRSQIRQKVFDRGWKQFAKSNIQLRTTIRETIERLCDEQVTLTLSLLDCTISMYEAILDRQQR